MIPDLSCTIDTDGLETGFDADMDKMTDGFSLPTNRYYLSRLHAAKALDKIKMRTMKRMIRPENAEALREHLPDHGETLHAVVRGDFVMCDLLPVLLDAAGTCHECIIATLGMSLANAQQIASLHNSGRIGKLTVLVSHYFSQIDKIGTFLQVKEILGDALIVARSHAKLFLIDGERNCFCVEGSANLRSSGCIEQFTVANDRSLFYFHQSWIQEITQ